MTPDAADAAAALGDRAVTPGDAAWDDARQAWNLSVDQRPALVARPRSADDVADVLIHAKACGLRVAPQGTGHNARPLGPLEDVALLKTDLMQGVAVDPAARRARVEAGALWGPIVDAAGEHGLAALAGSAADVGAVGYTLGGGLSWMARQHGLACNRVLAVELVTADGRLVRADARHEPELFWALRGGGGGFGVVTALEFELLPVPEIYAGAVFFDGARAGEVLQAWREWTAALPESVTSLGRILTPPDLPDVPEPLRGRTFALVEAALLGDAAQAADLLSPLRALGPEMDTFATQPAAQLKHLHMDPPGPVPGAGNHQLLSGVEAATVDALVQVAGTESGSPLLSVEIRHAGGAAGRPDPDGGALAALPTDYACFGVGIAATPELASMVNGQLDKVAAALAPWTADAEFMNFAERPASPERMFGPEALARLRDVKAAFDRDGLIVSNQPVDARS